MGITVSDATLILAAITVISFFGTIFYNRSMSNKDSRLKLIEKKLDEFYFPALAILSFNSEYLYDDENNLYKLKQLILSKSYLMQLSPLSSKSKYNADTRRSILRTIISESFSSFFSKSSEKEMEDLSAFGGILLEDASFLTNEYYRLSGENYESEVVPIGIG